MDGLIDVDVCILTFPLKGGSESDCLTTWPQSPLVSVISSQTAANQGLGNEVRSLFGQSKFST